MTPRWPGPVASGMHSTLAMVTRMGIDARARGTRVLLVDNYSSFTYNLYQALAELTGVLPVVVANDCEDELDLSAFDAAVLSPGPGRPENFGDFGICRGLLAQSEVPVLGVCLGHQGLGVMEGATLVRLDEPVHGRASTIVHTGAELFSGLPTRFKAIRYHSLFLQEPLPEALECVARSEDGEIMALRHRKRPHWGVQFHPESVSTEYGAHLLANFCALCRPEHAAPSTASSSTASSSTASSSTGRASQPCEHGGASGDQHSPKRWQSHQHQLQTTLSAEQLFTRLYADAGESFWPDGSAEEGHSYFGDSLGARSYSLRYRRQEKQALFSGSRSEQVPCDSIFALLEDELAANTVEGAPSEFAFVGGLVGYFGYELKGDLGFATRHSSSVPDAHWIWADRFVVYDHKNERATLVMLVPSDEGNAGADGADAHPAGAGAWFRDVEAKLASPPVSSAQAAAGKELCIEPQDTQEAYLGKIASCLEHIAAGESYELCLTTQLSAELRVDPLQLFGVMREQNPAPYAAFLRCSEYALVCASPERFMRIDSERYVESKPIKGTSRRDPDYSVDRDLARILQASEKECAENLMIVDLVRNDLGKSCEIGSVVVAELAALESFATVHQLVSTIRGRLRSEISSLRCVRDAFPGGSMTGAPKRRSVEILDLLESGARGPYSGCLGFLGWDGAVDLGIVIRSVLVEEGRVQLGVGGAITSLSDSERELAEIRLKSKAQIRALQTVCAPS